jgi:hypothetical protein
MTENVQELTTEQREAVGSPTPQFSGVSQGDASKAEADAGLVKRLAALEAALEAKDRREQSAKDKAIDRMSRELEAVKRYLPTDMHEKLDRASREADLDQIREQWRGQSQPTSSPVVRGRTAEDRYLDRAKEILQDPDLGLSQDEMQEVLTKVSKKDFTSINATEEERINMALGEVSKQTILVKNRNLQKAQPASLAGVIAPSGHGIRAEDPDTEYHKEMDLINQGKHPTIKRGQTKAILDLRRKYASKGVGV